MILTPKILARLAAAVILGVLLQLCFFSQVTFLQVSPDMLPALVVALGLLGGSMTGAVTGFCAGLLLDTLLMLPLGGSSLVLLGTGYAAGLFRERFEIHSPLVPPLLCMALTFAAELGFGAVELTLGPGGPVSLLVVRDMLVQAIFAFFGGWAIFIGLRRALRPALVEEPTVRPRRRPRMIGA